MYKNDKKLVHTLHRRLLTTKLSGIVYALLILSLSLSVSFIFYFTAIRIGGIFYAFIVFIPIILSFTLIAVYYKLKLTWGKTFSLRIVVFLGTAFLFVFLAYFLSL